MKTLLTLSLAVAGLASDSAAQATPGGFHAGDLYMHTVAWTGISSTDGAIVRIDPATGAKAVLHDLQSSAPGTQMMTFDPWRDRLLFFGGFVPNNLELFASDAAGNVQSLGLATTAGGARGLLTPRGDGIVYLLDPLNSSVLSYLDATDQVQVLQDASGSGPWSFGLPMVQIQSLLYVPKTNSLLLTRWSFVDPCAGIPTNVTALHRLDLSSDGSRVVGESCFWYDSNPAGLDGATRGLSLGPDGDPILVIGNGGTDLGGQQRIARIDMASDSAAPFATVDFIGHNLTMGGTFSRTLGKAVLHDTFGDRLAAFGAGESGPGSTIATGVSPAGGAGENASLIEVGPLGSPTGLTANTSTVSLAAGGSQVLTIDVGATFAGNIYVGLGSITGWSPGLVVDGLPLPLNYDVYFDWVLAHPNQFPLFGSLGALDGSGVGSMTFTLPPGSDPGWVGLVAHHAAVVLHPVTSVVHWATNPVPVELVP